MQGKLRQSAEISQEIISSLHERPSIHSSVAHSRLGRLYCSWNELDRAGLSNEEIAGHLIVTVGTVKTHIRNIYGKLGVNSRTKAIARARELNLL